MNITSPRFGAKLLSYMSMMDNPSHAIARFVVDPEDGDRYSKIQFNKTNKVAYDDNGPAVAIQQKEVILTFNMDHVTFRNGATEPPLYSEEHVAQAYALLDSTLSDPAQRSATLNTLFRHAQGKAIPISFTPPAEIYPPVLPEPKAPESAGQSASPSKSDDYWFSLAGLKKLLAWAFPAS